MSRPSWDEYGLKLAETAASRAACTRRQNGAAILGLDHRVLALGYNGQKPGATECVDGGCPRGAFGYDEIPTGLGNAGHDVPCTAIHAEINALLHASGNYSEEELSASTIYVTSPPCSDCQSAIDYYGLKLVTPDDPRT